jgi:S1-C subfamily serine protease
MSAGRSRDLYERARQASVEVLVAGRLEGSGWLADANGLAVTAAHVVRKHPDRVEVISPVAGRLPAKVIAVDRGHDLALLELPGREKPYPALEVAEKMPPPTSSIFLYGAVQFRHGLLVRGTVARREAAFEYLFNLKQYIRAYYVVAPTPNGTSGGCWLDRHGRVVGSQSGFMLRNGNLNGIAYVIPPDAVRRLVRTRKSADTPTIGAAVEEIWEQQVDWIKQYPPGTEGIVPVRIHENGPAAKAGIEARSLVVTKIDGKPVRYRDELLHLVRSRRVGDEITLEVLRPDAKSAEKIKLRLGRLERE